jgi:hypothetical protein
MRVFAALAAVTLLAGCLAVDEPSKTGSSTETVTDPKMPGLVMHLELVSHDGRHILKGLVKNNGSRTYQIEQGCNIPWSEGWKDPQGKEYWGRAPRYQCLAFSLKTFGPGQSDSIELQWNETRWDDSKSKLVPIGPGEHTWKIFFRAYNQSGGDAGTLSGQFKITRR